MRDCLIVCQLGEAPPGALPPWGGVVECAEERGFFWLRPEGERFQRLPEGTLWGRFGNSRDAITAFDRSVTAASELLGYPIRVNRRLLSLIV